jgi:hypothetical protein
MAIGNERYFWVYKQEPKGSFCYIADILYHAVGVGGIMLFSYIVEVSGLSDSSWIKSQIVKNRGN